MKTIIINRKELKALSVIAIIGISMLYNSKSSFADKNETASKELNTEIAIVEKKQTQAAHQLMDNIKIIIFSGIKQIISTH